MKDKNFKLTQEEVEIIENNNFDLRIKPAEGFAEVELHQFTPAGEDWYLSVTVPEGSSFIDELEELVNDTSWSDDDLVMWIAEKQHGSVCGIPEIKDLINDCTWKKAIVKKVYFDLKYGYTKKSCYHKLKDGTIITEMQLQEAFRYQKYRYHLEDAKWFLTGYFANADEFKSIFKRDMDEALEDDDFLDMFVKVYEDSIATGDMWYSVIDAVIANFS